MDFWCRKRPLFQLGHYLYPLKLPLLATLPYIESLTLEAQARSLFRPKNWANQFLSLFFVPNEVDDVWEPAGVSFTSGWWGEYSMTEKGHLNF